MHGVGRLNGKSLECGSSKCEFESHPIPKCSRSSDGRAVDS